MPLAAKLTDKGRSIPLIPVKSPEARQPSLLTACPPPEPVMLLTAAAWLLVAVR